MTRSACPSLCQRLLAALLWLLPACGGPSYTVLRVKGSDSEVNLVQALAEHYMDQTSGVSIGVSGGGSGAGLAALINGKTDIANSSREISAEEYALAAQSGPPPVATVFATDALAIIAHPANPIAALSLEDLGRLYRGEIANWRALGGEDREVSLYGRQSNSGTFVYFRQKVLGADYSPRLISMNGSGQLVEAVKQDLGGIAYVSVGYVLDAAEGRGIKVLAVEDASGTAYSPADTAALLAGAYPLSRPLFQYTRGEPSGAAKAFMDFERSPAGVAILRANGFLPPPDTATSLSSPR